MSLLTERMVQLPRCKINSKYKMHFVEFSVDMITIMLRISDMFFFVLLDLGNLRRKLHVLVQRETPYHHPMQNLILCLLRKLHMFLQI